MAMPFYNVHASLLPKYRGAAPIQRAIERGETETGVTIMRIDEQLDHGPMLLAVGTSIDPDEHTPALSSRLSALGAEALLRALRERAFAAPLLAHESGFVRTLVLGVLRWRSRLDFAVARHAKRKIDDEVLDVLRVVAYQLLYMDIARYATVAETVELAPKHARGF